MGGLARAYLGRGRRRACRSLTALGLLARPCRRDPHQGPDGADVRRPRRPGPVDPRAVRRAGSCALRPWPGSARDPRRRAALVRRHRPARPAGAFFAASVGQDMLGKVGAAQRHGRRRASTCSLLRHLLARRRPRGHRRAVRLGDRRDDAVAFLLAWIVPSWIVLRDRADQAAALRDAALSGRRDPDGLAVARGFVGPRRPRRHARDAPDPPHSGRADRRACSRRPGPSTERCPSRRCRCSWPPASPSLSRLARSSLAATSMARRSWRASSRRPFLALASSASPSSTCARSSCRRGSAEVGPRLACPEPRRRDPRLPRAEPRLPRRHRPRRCSRRRGGGRLPERRRLPASSSSTAVRAGFQAGSRARSGLTPTLSTRVSGFNINSGRRLDIGAYAVRRHEPAELDVPEARA